MTHNATETLIYQTDYQIIKWKVQQSTNVLSVMTCLSVC